MRHVGLILLLAFGASAQVQDGITASVTRTVYITPDEADFNIVVAAPLDTTQEQVMQTLEAAGIPGVTLLNVAAGQNNAIYPPPADSQVFYQFVFTCAPSAFKDYAKKLDALRSKPPETLVGVQYGVALNASTTAVASAHDSTLPQLLADARTKAQSLATAAGLKLGSIAGLTESSYGTYALQNAVLMTSMYGSSLSSTNIATQYTFYATVKFAVE